MVIPILTVVDAVGLATSGQVNGNVYIFDNQGYRGEQEGGTELTTKCTENDIIQWTIIAIQVDADISIANFRGEAVDNFVIRPSLNTNMGEPYWGSRVQLANNAPKTFQYTFDIVINNTHYAFDPFLDVKSS
jgi:hypothetical protein